MGTVTSWNPLGHPRPVTGLRYLWKVTNIEYVYKGLTACTKSVWRKSLGPQHSRHLSVCNLACAAELSSFSHKLHFCLNILCEKRGKNWKKKGQNFSPKLREKKQLVRPRRRWYTVDIKANLKSKIILRSAMDWSFSTWRPFASSCKYCNELSDYIELKIKVTL